MNRRIAITMFSAALLVACKDDEKGGDTGAATGASTEDTGTSGAGDTEECVDGHEGCPCADTICLEGLKCLSNLCVMPEEPDPGDDTGADGGTDDGGDGADDGQMPDVGMSCEPGTYLCECGPMGECDPPLVCEAALGYGLCVEEQCLEQYDECFVTGECCDDMLCFGYASLNQYGCGKPCDKHSDCPITRCTTVNGYEQNYCDPVGEYETLCIDTCGSAGVYDGSWAGDGFCDDGGPDSDYSGCELGTDCMDCGNR